jgi:AcrR family transcriptional regulator
MASFGDALCHHVRMPKIIGGSLREHREQTRRRLFDALSALLAERGFDQITLADIAATAGVGRTAVYNHFADKEALLVAFIADETAQYAEGIQRQLDQIADPVAQLRHYVRAQVLLRHEHNMPSTDLRALVSRPTQARLHDHVVAFEAVLRDLLRRGIDTGVFPEQDLATTVPLINACLSGRTPTGDAATRERTLAQTEQFVLRAVGAVADVA